ncbi:HWE histidine kinase domain-containing protein [Methylocella sp.]|uniref:HWE histidine kinase domain-containing protein n=1 Tax=Methylocella sp. TaxID=1978226 RepID=UPI003784ABB3
MSGPSLADALARQGAEFRAVLDALDVAVTVFDREGRLVRANAAARALFGLAAPLDQPLPFSAVAAGFVARDAEGASFDACALRPLRVLESGAAQERSFRVAAPDGCERAFEARELPLVVDGEIQGAIAVWRDVTAARARDDQASILLRELSHRSKNLLTVIESIVRQSAKGVGSKDEFVARVGERLRALAQSHDLLARASSMSVPMTDLIFSQLGHHWEPGQRRIALAGLGVRLKPDAAQMIGMALHELSTNATKYGALSGPGGRVSIAWRVEKDDNAEPVFLLSWTERGGPPVAPPQRAGFGTTVVDRVVGRALRGAAKLDFAPEGLAWVLRAPCAHVLDPSEDEGRRPEAIRSPALEALRSRWAALCRDGRPPRFTDMPIAEIEPKDHLILAAVDHAETPPAVRFLSVGRALAERVDARRYEHRHVAEHEILGAQDGAYRRCIDSARPSYEYAYFDLGADRFFFFERILVPLAGDDAAISHVLGLASFEDFGALKAG